MKTRLASIITTLIFSGSGFAADRPVADSFKADGFRIDSEAQFTRDYGDQIEQVGPGVYQVVKGKLAGKTISIGEAGLRYDIAATRAVTPRSKSERTQLTAHLQRLEKATAHYADMHARDATNAGKGFTTNLSQSGGFSCQYFPHGGRYPIYYSGGAFVSAVTELYLDRGDGLMNPYYARAKAYASGLVYIPGNVPASISLSAYAFAHERQIGQPVFQESVGISAAVAEAGYVYSGPAFFHDMAATAVVSGQGNCYGYVSVTDSMNLWY